MDRKMKIRTAIVPNTNCRYVAYEDGRIFDKRRNVFISQSISKCGWLRCHIWFNNIRKTIGVHRVIMMAFYGESKLTVNHIDGNKQNNNLSNLEYMTSSEQNKHRSYILKRGNRVSVKCIETGLIYETIKDASIALGIDCSHISACCQKKYGFKSVHGFHFEYYPLCVEDIEKVDESS